MKIIQILFYVAALLAYEVGMAQNFQTIVQSGHTSSVQNIQFSNDSKYLFSMDRDGNLKTWELSSGLLIYDTITEAKHGMSVNPLKYNNLLLFGFRNVILLDPVSGDLKYSRKLKDDNLSIDDVIWINSGIMLLSDKYNPYCYAYQIDNDSLNNPVKLGFTNSMIYDMDISNNQKEIAFMKKDSVFIFVNGKMRKYENKVNADLIGSAHVEASFSSDRRYLMLNNFKEIDVISVSNGNKLFSVEANVGCWGIGDTLFCDDSKGNIVAYCINSGKRIFEFDTHGSEINFWKISNMEFNEKLGYLASSSEGDIYLWNASNGNLVWRTPVSLSKISTLAINPVKNQLLTNYGEKNKIKLWDIDKLTSTTIDFTNVTTLSFDNTGKFLVVGILSELMDPEREHKTIIYDYENSKIISEEKGSMFFNYKFDNDGEFMAYISGDFYGKNKTNNEIVLYDFITGISRTITLPENNWIVDLWLKSNKLYYVYNITNDQNKRDYYLVEYDIFQENEIWKEYLYFIREPLTVKVALSNDARYLAYSGLTNIYIVDVKQNRGKVISIVRSDYGVINIVYPIEESNFLFTTENGYVFSVMPWNNLPFNVIRCHKSEITDIGFVSNPDRFITTGEDGQIKMWDSKSLDLIASIVNVGEYGYVVWTPDNYYMASNNVQSGIGFKSVRL
jgi:WD40 repeat protein